MGSVALAACFLAFAGAAGSGCGDCGKLNPRSAEIISRASVSAVRLEEKTLFKPVGLASASAVAPEPAAKPPPLADGRREKPEGFFSRFWRFISDFWRKL